MVSGGVCFFLAYRICNDKVYANIYASPNKYIHTYIHTYKHTCIHTYIHLFVFVSVRLRSGLWFAKSNAQKTPASEEAHKVAIDEWEEPPGTSQAMPQKGGTARNKPGGATEAAGKRAATKFITCKG